MFSILGQLTAKEIAKEDLRLEPVDSCRFMFPHFWPLEVFALKMVQIA